MRKALILSVIIVMLASMFTGCTDAEVAAKNVSKAADQFEIYRRVVFYNAITDTYILVIEGYCSIGSDMDGDFYVVVKTGPGMFLKHYLGLSDNVSYFAEQIEPAKVSDGRYRVIFKPSVIIPDFDLE